MEQGDLQSLINRTLTGNRQPGDKERMHGYFLEYGLPEEELAEDERFYPSEEQVQRARLEVMKVLPRPNPVVLLKWAAAAMLIGALLTVGLTWRKPTAPPPVASIFRNNGNAIRHLRLADGSEVWLNKGASIALYEQNYVTDRTIRMQGEAYFEVAPDPVHPFVVFNGRLPVKVLGTAFNIRADSATRATITLYNGKVAVGDRVLTPGEEVQYDHQQHTLITTNGAWKALAWKTGELRGDNQPLEAVLQYIGEYYHVKIQYQRPVRNLWFSGTISLREALPVVMDRLLFVYGLHYTQKEGTIIIH